MEEICILNNNVRGIRLGYRLVGFHPVTVQMKMSFGMLFLGPRGPLIEPSIPVRPSVHPSAQIFPEFIDELKHCRQASGTPQIVYFLKAHDVSYPNSDKNSNTETNTNTNTNTETNTKTETNKGKPDTPML